jgi:hypothetical protein
MSIDEMREYPIIMICRMQGEWNLFFVTSYFVTSARLFWHNRFFIYDNKEKSKSHFTERSGRY